MVTDPAALANKFCEAAIAWSHAGGDLKRQNRLADVLQAHINALTETLDGRRALAELFEHPNFTVQAYAASALRVFPRCQADARRTLERIVAVDDGPDGALAELFLDVWDAPGPASS